MAMAAEAFGNVGSEYVVQSDASILIPRTTSNGTSVMILAAMIVNLLIRDVLLWLERAKSAQKLKEQSISRRITVGHETEEHFQE